MPQRTNKEIIHAIRESRGLVAVAARKLGVGRQTIYDRLERSSEVKEALDEAREFTGDVAEAKLYNAIEEGEPWAVQFYLKTQARRRGYTEKMEHEHSGKNGEPMAVEVKLVEPEEGDAGDG